MLLVITEGNCLQLTLFFSGDIDKTWHFAKDTFSDH